MIHKRRIDKVNQNTKEILDFLRPFSQVRDTIISLKEKKFKNALLNYIESVPGMYMYSKALIRAIPQVTNTVAGASTRLAKYVPKIMNISSKVLRIYSKPGIELLKATKFVKVGVTASGQIFKEAVKETAKTATNMAAKTISKSPLIAKTINFGSKVLKNPTLGPLAVASAILVADEYLPRLFGVKDEDRLSASESIQKIVKPSKVLSTKEQEQFQGPRMDVNPYAQYLKSRERS